MMGAKGAMIRARPALVTEIIKRREGLTKVIVDVEGEDAEALNYEQLTGPIEIGDRVILNTTAEWLRLGSGGNHFVMFNENNRRTEIGGSGHIMKLRYTPLQLRVLSCEEREAGYIDSFARFKSLSGMPVIIGELHSMLLPALVTLKTLKPEGRFCYIMTDGAALPLVLSDTVSALKKHGYLETTITCGHAFGGDLEAVNVYSALAASLQVVGADACIITMGPGVVGTGTRYGFSGVEQGEHINRVALLKGTPLGILRLSFADRRLRHQGVSHHTLTALGEIAQCPCEVPLPVLEPAKMSVVEGQLQKVGIYAKHCVQKMDVDLSVLEEVTHKGIKAQTMGRGLKEDPAFFLAAVAAGKRAVELLAEKGV